MFITFISDFLSIFEMAQKTRAAFFPIVKTQVFCNYHELFQNSTILIFKDNTFRFIEWQPQYIVVSVQMPKFNFLIYFHQSGKKPISKKPPCLHNIVLIRLNTDKITVHFLSNPGCGTASREKIQDQAIFLATDFQEPFNHLFRFLRRVKSYIFPLLGGAFNKIVHGIHFQEIEQSFLLLEEQNRLTTRNEGVLLEMRGRIGPMPNQGTLVFLWVLFGKILDFFEPGE